MQTKEETNTLPAISDIPNRGRGKSSIKKDIAVNYRQYEGEEDLPLIMQLVDNELSEPYSIFTYRYFLHNWPKLCWLAFDGPHCFGTVVCKQDKHRELVRGYIAMLVVEHEYRGLGVGTELVKRCIQQMVADQADEVVLEAEITNKGALALYENLGFIRDKRLLRYYLSGSDAFRLKLLLPLPPERMQQMQDEQIAAKELTNLSLGPAAEPSAETASTSQLTPVPSISRLDDAAVNGESMHMLTTLDIVSNSTAAERHDTSSKSASAKGLGNGLQQRQQKRRTGASKQAKKR